LAIKPRELDHCFFFLRTRRPLAGLLSGVSADPATAPEAICRRFSYGGAMPESTGRNKGCSHLADVQYETKRVPQDDGTQPPGRVRGRF
jgi:hypothetical protein